MRNLFFIALSALFLSSCITGTKTAAVSGIENLPRDSYTILDEKTEIARTNKVWFLFIPFHSKSEEKREAQCYERMIKQYHADGIIGAKYVHRKITIPLIVITYSYKYTTLTGKPFVIKTDTKTPTK